MSGRAFYRASPDAIEDAGGSGALGCVELRRTPVYSWLYAPRDPHPELEELGAERLAGDWGEFWVVAGSLSAGTRDHIFDVLADIQDPETGDLVRRRMSRREAYEVRGLPEKEVAVPGGDRHELAAPANGDGAEGVVTGPLVPISFHPGETQGAQAALDAAAGG